MPPGPDPDLTVPYTFLTSCLFDLFNFSFVCTNIHSRWTQIY
jgi:hypothetical protein